VGDGVEISTAPEPVPQLWLLIAIPGALLVLIALSMGFIYGVLAAGFCYGVMYLLTRDSQRRDPSRHRAQSRAQRGRRRDHRGQPQRE
jgi:hypothetical protein